MIHILFYALLTASGTAAPGTQEFADKAACEAAVDALRDNWRAAPAFCVPKGTEPEPAPISRASGSTSATAPTARK